MFGKFRRWFTGWLLAPVPIDPDVSVSWHYLTYIGLSGLPYTFVLMSGRPPERRKLTMHAQFKVEDKDFVKSSFTLRGGIITVCAEVARKPEGVAMRNSNDPTKNTLFFTPGEWDAFIKGVKNDEFNLV